MIPSVNVKNSVPTLVKGVNKDEDTFVAVNVKPPLIGL